MHGIDSDLASKALAADSRNIVKHVGEGGRMSSTERGIMEAEAVMSMSDEERQRLRVGALLLRQMRGQRLTDDEKGEIDLAFPTSVSSARAITRETYKEVQQHYAEVYGVSDRSIKTWIKEGRKAADLPPLDQPGAMAEWYGRVKKRRIPLELLRLKSSPGKAPAAPAVDSSTDQTPPPGAKTNGVALNADFSYDLAVQFAAENLQHAQEQLRQAREIQNNDGRIEACERSVTRAMEGYRKAKNDEAENLKRGGGHVDKRLMLDKFRTRLAAVHQGVRSCPVRVGTKLALEPDLVRQITRAMNEELDAVFTQLQTDGWVHKERFALEAA